jgi:hypothetical protein
MIQGVSNQAMDRTVLAAGAEMGHNIFKRIGIIESGNKRSGHAFLP